MATGPKQQHRLSFKPVSLVFPHCLFRFFWLAPLPLCRFSPPRTPSIPFPSSPLPSNPSLRLSSPPLPSPLFPSTPHPFSSPPFLSTQGTKKAHKTISHKLFFPPAFKRLWDNAPGPQTCREESRAHHGGRLLEGRVRYAFGLFGPQENLQTAERTSGTFPYKCPNQSRRIEACQALRNHAPKHSNKHSQNMPLRSEGPL